VEVRQVRNVIIQPAQLTKTSHPRRNEKDKFSLIYITPKYRHGAHSTPVDIDIMSLWFGPFGDVHRRDKRMPWVGEGYVDLNPDDAKELGIEDGDYVYIDADPEDRPFRGWQEKPEDYVIATGVTTTVRDFVRMAFSHIGVELEFTGEVQNEVGKVASSKHKDYLIEPGTEVVAVDANYFRPTEVDLLIGDPTKAQTKLGWKPKRSVQDMVREMVESDLRLFHRDKILLSNGMEILKNDE